MEKHMEIQTTVRNMKADCHTYLCCLENMNKNTTVSPNIPKIIIKNHGNRKSETQENNISLTGLPRAEVDIALSFFT